MVTRLHYLRESLSFSGFKTLLFLCLALCSQETQGECKEHNKMQYVADGFGYITIDWDSGSMDIFKTIPLAHIHLNVANCSIKKTNEKYVTISSRQPTTCDDLDIHIYKEREQSPDSVLVKVKIPGSEAAGQYLMIYPSVGREEKHLFSSTGLVEFHLKKYDFELDNCFSLVIFPEIQPFETASSWGDSETLSFMDLRMDRVLNLTDPDISKIEIDVPGFSNEIFRKWVIHDDFVLKDGADIIWRNMRFVRTKTD